MKLFLFIFSCFLFSTKLISQYKGGVGDGVAVAVLNATNLGVNIYTGGAGDGKSSAYANAVNLGQNIFLGGQGDGKSTAYVNAVNLGQNIYLGGVGDGKSSANVNAALLGQNIYTGGIGDGKSMAFFANAVLLPINLTSITAMWKDQNAILQWRTSSELNTAWFDIERSADGKNFKSIGKQKASGNSSVELTYEYSDVAPLKFLPSETKIIYYRLKTIDLDGKYTLSAVVVLPVNASNLSVSLIPNPAQQFVVINVNQFNTNTNNIQLQIADVNGKVLLNKKLLAFNERIELDKYSNGIYFITIYDNSGRLYTQKLIITK
jgi:hypothetical protein